MNRAVFIDRDGVLNKEIDLLTHPNQFKLLGRAADAIRLLNKNNIRVIVATNQPVVARGLCTEKDVKKIHQKMKEKLLKKKAKIDAVYYCPHHPERHHKDIKPRFKRYRIDCKCRKPKIGMLLKAKKRFNLDLKSCFMIGDKTTDIKTGKNAKCKTILVKTGYGGKDGKYKIKPDYICENLYQAAKLIVKK